LQSELSYFICYCFIGVQQFLLLYQKPSVLTMSCCCEFQGCKNDANIVAVIFDLDGTLLDTGISLFHLIFSIIVCVKSCSLVFSEYWLHLYAERATRGVLSEFLGKYGKELNREREEKKRLGMTQKESAAFIVRDYQLPLTPDQFIKEINPLYIERYHFVLFFSLRPCLNILKQAECNEIEHRFIPLFD